MLIRKCVCACMCAIAIASTLTASRASSGQIPLSSHMSMVQIVDYGLLKTKLEKETVALFFCYLEDSHSHAF